MSGSPSNGVDDVLKVLADSRRRHALCCLQRHGELSLPDLAEEVTVREDDAPLPEVSAERVSEVYFSLYHTHVPKLEEVGFVRYNQQRDLVTGLERIDPAVRDVQGELDAILDT